jgi:hypothetical protein
MIGYFIQKTAIPATIHLGAAFALAGSVTRRSRPAFAIVRTQLGYICSSRVVPPIYDRGDSEAKTLVTDQLRA